MNKYELYMLLATLINLAAPQRTYLEGNYWRDYEGMIPTDALPGGTDQNGKSIYIGQELHNSLLIPGKTYDNDNKMYYEWNQKEFTATGGYQKYYSTYIGRAFASRETSVGKVICQETDCLGLYTSKVGKIAKHRNAFEVLTYNPKNR